MIHLKIKNWIGVQKYTEILIVIKKTFLLISFKNFNDRILLESLILDGTVFYTLSLLFYI